MNNNFSQILSFEEFARWPLVPRFCTLVHDLFGASISLIKHRSNASYHLSPPDQLGVFCTRLQTDPRGHALCIQCDRDHQNEAYKKQKTLCYKCHAGLIDIIVPIIINSEIIAFFQSGQFLSAPPTEADWLDLLERIGHLKVDFNLLKKNYFNIPVVSSSAQKNLVEMLEIFATVIMESGNRLLLFEENPAPKIVMRAQLFIREHLYENIRLDAIAKAACTSKRNLTRIFLKYADMTIIDFISTSRVEAACTRLLQSDGGIAKIAFECGFGSVQQFNRIFKKITGNSPRIWRTENLKRQNSAVR